MMMSNVINAAQSSFKQVGEQGPVAVFEGIDRFMHDALSNADMFVTLLVGAFDTQRRRLSLVNAGHSPVHFVHDGNVEPLPASRPPIGVIAGLPCERLDLDVDPGDRFVAASDGFPEQADDAGVMFGDERFAAALVADAHARDFGPGLFDAIRAFAGDAAQSDDRTLFVLDFGAAS